MTLVSIRIIAAASVEPRWFGHRLSRRQVQVHPAQRGEPAMDSLAEVRRPGRLSDGLAQDFPRLLLHRPAVLGRADAQTAFQSVVEVANRDAGHGVLIGMSQD